MTDDVHERQRKGWLSSLAIRRPVGTLALASVVFVLGLYFLSRLPVDLLPAIEYPQVRITVNYPGVAPEVLEQQVTRVLERNLAATENLTNLSSRVRDGRTDLDLSFDFGTDLDLALQDAARYLEQARSQLPSDIEPPRIRKFDSSQETIWRGGFSSTVRSEAQVQDWVDNNLAPQLTAVSGVASVEAIGGMIREMEVVLDQMRLRDYGLTMEDVTQALERENVDIAGGRLTSPTFDIQTQTDGLFRSASDIGNVLLTLPDSVIAPDGSVNMSTMGQQRVRLSDVAEVRDGAREQRVFARLNGVPSTQVDVYKLPGSNTVAVADRVQSTLARLQRSGFIPDDIQYQATSDPSFFIRGAISSVSTAALLGGLLAMIMVLFFLGSLRKGFVIGLSIPVAIMATFSMMGMAGLTLNIISMGGLALGVGLLLDNAIVMLENIYRHREKLGKSPQQAAVEGAGEVVSAITAGTMTNLAAVLPFLLISGAAALVFNEMILTISFAIVATLAAALTLVPMLAALLGKVRFESGLVRSAPVRGFGVMIEKLRNGYRGILPGVLRWRWGVLTVAFLALAGSGWLFTQLGNEFLPALDDGEVRVRINMPPGTPPQETLAMAREVEAFLQQDPYVQTVFTLAGGQLWGGVVTESASRAQFIVQMTRARDRPEKSAGRWVQETQRAVEAMDIPGARVSVRPPGIRGLRFTSTGDDLVIGIVGEQLETLQTLSRDVSERLEGIPGLEGLESADDDQTPLMRVNVDRERAAEMGMRVSEVGQAIRAAVDGAVPTRFTTASREYDIRVRLPDADVSNTDRLGNLMVSANGGEPVYLRDLVTFVLGEGPTEIQRENQSRIVRVVADINTAVADVGTVMGQVESRLADMDVPEQYNLIFGGQWETIQDTNRELGLVVMLSIFLVFVVLAVQYDRLSNPLVIISAAPLSLIGVTLILWATGTPVSAPVLIGLVLLIGIVVNNAILLVEYIEIGREKQGLSVANAIVEAGSIRLRPILMTTSTTVLGMLPLAIGMGEGSEIMRPLALAVVGGLSISMVLTLFVVPCLYMIINRLAERLVELVAGKPPGQQPG
ncbi:MAG: efflux RND transporter permease subunit [Halomonadaceae bacterium]|nr:MAG: efflux RND transporter permease subunit [Halomonadaceae bacterium]